MTDSDSSHDTPTQPSGIPRVFQDVIDNYDQEHESSTAPDAPERLRLDPSLIGTIKPVQLEHAVRPDTFADIVGQTHIKASLARFISAARGRGRALDHTLFYGPPGLGKTTLASVIAAEMGHDLKMLTGPQITAAEVVHIVTEIAANNKPLVVFVDEVHEIDKLAMTLLLPILEDFQFEGFAIQPFTLVGATTDPDKLLRPLFNRFRNKYPLTYYSVDELRSIITSAYTKLAPDLDLTRPAAIAAISAIALRSKGNPRDAIQLVRCVLDFQYSANAPGGYRPLTLRIVKETMQALDIDVHGLNRADRDLLRTMAERFRSRAVGLEPLAAALGESRRVIEQVVEPNLVRLGFIDRELKGRVLTHKGLIVAGREIEGATEY